jgi:hypothetical protein
MFSRRGKTTRGRAQTSDGQHQSQKTSPRSSGSGPPGGPNTPPGEPQNRSRRGSGKTRYFFAPREACKSIVQRPRGPPKKLWCRPRASWRNSRLIFQPPQGPQRLPQGLREALRRLILELLFGHLARTPHFLKIELPPRREHDFRGSRGPPREHFPLENRVQELLNGS